MKTFNDFWTEAQADPLYWAETTKLEFATQVNECMTEQETSKTDIAKKVGVSKQYISKVLGGNANFTIESMAKIAFALGQKLVTTMEPLKNKSTTAIYNESIVWFPSVVKNSKIPCFSSWEEKDRVAVIEPYVGDPNDGVAA